MEVLTLCENLNNSNTYVVGTSNEVIVIDPSNDYRSIKKLINERKLLGIFLTHGHYDHFKSVIKMLEIYDCLLYLNKEAYKKLSDPLSSCSIYFGEQQPFNIDVSRVKFIGDGQKITLGEINLKVLHTKGHTNCSICLIIDDLLFSGDTLFNNGIGRYDLPTASLNDLINSIKMLLNLKTNYFVYPGHNEPTTIFDEVKNNYFYQKIK